MSVLIMRTFKGSTLAADADSNLTSAGKLLLLVEAAPRCRCGGNCETLQFLARELLQLQVKEAGWR
jgi:hypothetical protein